MSCVAAALALAFSAPALALPFTVTNLVTDDQLANPAQITDPLLKNAWGVAISGGSPFWVGDNGTGVSTLYTVNPLTNATTKGALVVTIPGDGTVTGVAFNGTTGFGSDRFLFVSEDGTVSGWRNPLGTNAEVLQIGSADNVYKGTAFASTGGFNYLYAANFKAGKIDVIKGDSGAPDLAGSFTDPGIPSGFSPFNIVQLGGKLYVTYALQSAGGDEDVAGPGNGFVSVFDLQGNFLGRVTSQGTLNSPWGLAIAPTSFGFFGGDLLVGNFGDGTINAFDIPTGTFEGQLLGTNNAPLSIDGLWSLIVGNGGNGGSLNSLYFTAGPDGETHGLFGVIAAVPEPSSIAMFGFGLLCLGFMAGLHSRIGARA
jgi:uncharacterized protein (TIGR03118 family)